MVNNLENMPYNGEYHIALLFLEPQFISGISNVKNLILQQFPNTKLNIHDYIVNSKITNIEIILTEFTNSFPNANKVVICELTSIINKSTAFIKSNNLDILTICTSSTALTTQTLENALTYSYYLSKQVSSCFPIIEDYNIQNIVLMIENSSPNFGFMKSWKDTLYLQNNLLGKRNIIEYEFKSTDKNIFFIPNNSIVILLVDTVTIKNNIKRIIDSFNNNNNTTSIIFMTNLNYECEDIFENIPAMIALLVPAVYTKTTDLVYNCVSKLKIPFYGVYAFYDMLYTLNYCSEKNIYINKKNYVNANPFNNKVPSAWHSGYNLIEN